MYINRKDDVVVLTGKEELEVLSVALLTYFASKVEDGSCDIWEERDSFYRTLREMYFNLH